MTPTRALVLAFGPDPDAPPLRWFALFAAPGLLVLAVVGGLAAMVRAGDDALADFGEDD